MTLTAKKIAFVNHYMTLKSATKAAAAAGYSAATAYSAGSRLLKDADVAAEVARRMADEAMPAREVIARLSEHARGDIGDFAGVRTLEALAAHPLARLVKKFKRELRDGVETIELELYDAQAALVQLAKYHQVFATNADSWRRELEAAGIDVEQVENGLIDEFVSHLKPRGA